jgi:hypothetical protein
MRVRADGWADVLGALCEALPAPAQVRTAAHPEDGEGIAGVIAIGVALLYGALVLAAIALAR